MLLVIAYRTLVFYVVGVALIFYFLINVVPFLGACSLVDVIGRGNPNDPFVSTYYLLWTLFFYLPESFLTLFVVLSYFYIDYICINKLLAVIWLANCVYLTELVDFIPLNYFLVSTVSVETASNVLLLNPLNRYHPFIFYLSVVIILYIACAFLLGGSCWLSQFMINSISYATEYKVIYVVVINWLALWLGSWWAFQEGTWGGWWNSDISEMLGLIIILVGLIYLHAKAPHFKVRATSLFFYSCLSGFMLTYYFIQVNYELTSHNFGSRFFFFFNNNLLLFELITLLSVVVVNMLVYCTDNYIRDEYANLGDRYISISVRKVFFNLKVYLLIFFCMWFMISLIPLIDLFTQKYIHITDLFLSNVYALISFVFILATVYVFFEANVGYLKNQFFVLSTTPIFSTALGVSHYYKWTSSRLTHALLICFLLTNVQGADLVFLYWGHSTTYSAFYSTGDIYFFYSTVYVCDVSSFSRVNTSIDCSNFINSSWTQSSTLNAYDVDEFWLSHSANTLFNYFYFMCKWIKVFIVIESPDITVLSIVSALTIATLFNNPIIRSAFSWQLRTAY